jgi:hypothetical protein
MEYEFPLVGTEAHFIIIRRRTPLLFLFPKGLFFPPDKAVTSLEGTLSRVLAIELQINVLVIRSATLIKPLYMRVFSLKERELTNNLFAGFSIWLNVRYSAT